MTETSPLGRRFRARATWQHNAVLPTEIPIPAADRNPVPDVSVVGRRWYVCMTVPQGERRAAASLRRQTQRFRDMGLAPLDPYVPCATAWIARKRGELTLPRRETQTPMLRGYVFVGVEGALRPGHLGVMSDRDVERRNAHGLVAILGQVAGFGGRDEATCALSLDDEDVVEVARWAQRERDDAKANDYRAFLRHEAERATEARDAGPAYLEGQTVRVAKGPFTSFCGIVTGVDPVQARMLTEVHIFGRAVPVELDFADVELAA